MKLKDTKNVGVPNAHRFCISQTSFHTSVHITLSTTFARFDPEEEGAFCRDEYRCFGLKLVEEAHKRHDFDCKALPFNLLEQPFM